MNIQTVKTNLEQTIAGKEQLLEEYKKASLIAVRNDTPDRVTIGAMAGFLSVNIDELKRILQDVEQCVFDYDELKEDLKEANGRVRQLERENSDMGWQINPDRMGL